MNPRQPRDAAQHAIDVYRRVLALEPTCAEAHFNLGIALRTKSRLPEAIESFARAFQLKPTFERALAHKLDVQLQICDWRAFDQFAAARCRLGTASQAVDPFSLLALEDHPHRQALRARTRAKELSRQAEPFLDQKFRQGDRIRVGYFSPDFHEHPVLFLSSGLFREHDKARFEIFAFSYGPEDTSGLRNRFSENVEHFIDVRGMRDRAVTALARKHRLDIAIDLAGHTRNSRSGLFAYRFAPVQINYLGFAGTMGASFIDYIIADPIVIPPYERNAYTETIIYLPATYVPTDNQHRIASVATSREACGLPASGFVFCCFNQPFKIGPKEFDIWIRLLRRVEGSVLWLRSSNEWAEVNLRKEAAARDIDPQRLIFAKKLPHSEYLARFQHADLFLDTFNFNAHTTACDALWASLPVVTKAGRQMAARGAASILVAAGLPELVTDTEQDYEKLILQLASNPERLAAIKAKLKRNRTNQPLFDTEGYTRKFEKALIMAFERALRDST